MDLTEEDIELLNKLANGVKIEYALWPGLLQHIMPQLEQIAKNIFPPVPFLEPSTTSLQKPTSILKSQPESATSKSEIPHVTKENESVPPSVTRDTINKPPPPTFHKGDSFLKDSCTSSIAPGSLPPDIHEILNAITKTLRTQFSTYPPHTVQRLAELILKPKAHYKYLPAYLHALDRVVHVTSGANVYPLPAAVPDAAGAKILTNGVTDTESISWLNNTQGQAGSGFSGDESLGGALLTPIPWLKNVNDKEEPEIKTESTETIDGPNGPGGVETVSVSVNGVPSATLAGVGEPPAHEAQLRAEGGVTQGELLRQEQEAGVVPVSQLQSTHPLGDGEEGEHPHARGPDVIGDEDIGPQHPVEHGSLHGTKSIDVEAAVGRPVEPTDIVGSTSPSGKREAEDSPESEAKRVREESKEIEPKDDKNETEMQLKGGVEDAMDTTE